MRKYIAVSLLSLVSSTSLIASSEIVVWESENFRQRGDQIPTHLMLHCVGLSEDWVKTNYTKSSKNGGLGVSAHYYIPASGDKTVQLVDPKLTAFHAGVGEWDGTAAKRNMKGLNDYSIGIEIGCADYAQIDKQAYYPYSFYNYDNNAISRLIDLSCNILKENQIPSQNVVWHSDASPFRFTNSGEVIVAKTDPGPTFPAKLLAEHGIGIWPVEDRISDDLIMGNLETLAKNLQTFGYAFDQKDELQTKYAVQAFLMHYAPEEISWDDYRKQKSGPIWDGTVTENMTVRADNLANKRFQEFK